MAASDVVLIGELHEHPLGLGLAATLFEQLLASPAGEKAALSLESLTRDQQGVVDAYLRGETSEAVFRKAAQLEGDHSYPPGHRRMIEAAKRKGRPVIAANTARALVKRARLEGLEPPRALPSEQQAWVDNAGGADGGAYREGFLALMGGHGGVDAATMEGFFRAQNVGTRRWRGRSCGR
ncbi:ChaN family lipoprotein [Nannocystis sp.]|uniref:ChaN family lipoprotein n=1 Tax=Nannocystis sp. TaxID=1962667 RepID=UPI0025E0FACB|nr:ChaN family lipoprotein [Nannocystis sp.]MBK7826918.1 ChaN family lipoprotein [Nannocystis sp.]